MNLTEREYDVLRCICKGMNNNEASKEMFVTEHTIKAHMTSIMRKLNVKTRTQVMYIAFKKHIVDIDEI